MSLKNDYLAATVVLAPPMAPFLHLSSASATTSRILVVDDIEATRHGLAELLRLRGHTVCEASNGAEAMAMLHQHPDTCVVVLDLAMPGTNGYWFREQQLANPALAPIPVVVFTGSANRERLAQLRVTDVLLKPFSVDRLFDAVSRHCAA